MQIDDPFKIGGIFNKYIWFHNLLSFHTIYTPRRPTLPCNHVHNTVSQDEMPSSEMLNVPLVYSSFTLISCFAVGSPPPGVRGEGRLSWYARIIRMGVAAPSRNFFFSLCHYQSCPLERVWPCFCAVPAVQDQSDEPYRKPEFMCRLGETPQEMYPGMALRTGSTELWLKCRQLRNRGSLGTGQPSRSASLSSRHAMLHQASDCRWAGRSDLGSRFWEER
jgi:hypothetical protein